jgi:hypothetical protein
MGMGMIIDLLEVKKVLFCDSLSFVLVGLSNFKNFADKVFDRLVWCALFRV